MYIKKRKLNSPSDDGGGLHLAEDVVVTLETEETEGELHTEGGGVGRYVLFGDDLCGMLMLLPAVSLPLLTSSLEDQSAAVVVSSVAATITAGLADCTGLERGGWQVVRLFLTGGDVSNCEAVTKETAPDDGTLGVMIEALVAGGRGADDTTGSGGVVGTGGWLGNGYCRPLGDEDTAEGEARQAAPVVGRGDVATASVGVFGSALMGGRSF